MNPIIQFLVTRSVGRFLRQGLTALAGILLAKGLPGLKDGTMENLVEIGVGAAGLALSWAWSRWHDRLSFAKGFVGLGSPKDSACPKTLQVLGTLKDPSEGRIPVIFALGLGSVLALMAITACDTPPKAEGLAVAVREAVEAKAVADAGSTVGVAEAVSTSKTVKDATAALKGDSADTAAQVSEIIEATKDTAAVLAEGGATLAGSDNPAQYGAYVKAGATLAALGAAFAAWILRKRKNA